MSAPPASSDIQLLGECNGVINLDAKIPDGAFDPGVAEQKLNSSQVARSPVDQHRLRPAQGMRSVHGCIETDTGYPLRHEARILGQVRELLDIFSAA
jgi:hypothetical protein